MKTTCSTTHSHTYQSVLITNTRLKRFDKIFFAFLASAKELNKPKTLGPLPEIITPFEFNDFSLFFKPKRLGDNRKMVASKSLTSSRGDSKIRPFFNRRMKAGTAGLVFNLKNSIMEIPKHGKDSEEKAQLQAFSDDVLSKLD